MIFLTVYSSSLTVKCCYKLNYSANSIRHLHPKIIPFCLGSSFVSCHKNTRLLLTFLLFSSLSFSFSKKFDYLCTNTIRRVTDLTLQLMYSESIPLYSQLCSGYLVFVQQLVLILVNSILPICRFADIEETADAVIQKSQTI